MGLMVIEGRKVKIGDKEFTFQPLFYGEYSRFILGLPKLIEKISEKNPSLDLTFFEKNPFEAFGLMGAEFFSELLSWIALSLKDAKGKSAKSEHLEKNLKMADFSDLLVLFVEENDLARVIANFKKLGSVMKVGSLLKPSYLQTSGGNTHGPRPTTS